MNRGYDLGSASGRALDSRASGGQSGVNPAISEYTSLCAFWIGDRCFAIDTWMVGEVVTVENCIQVPLTPPALKGVFNLRGEPVPLVSLPIVLQLQLIEHNHGTTRTAIVIRAKEMLAALIADRMEPVLTDVRERITPAANGENETCFGFLELPRGGSRTIVSVLDSTALIRRLASLSYLQPRES